ITYNGALTGQNISDTAITSSNTGGVTTAVATTTQGVAPTSTDVLNHLNTITGLNGNVAVTGSAGGPFTITFSNALTGKDQTQLTAAITGGLTTTPATTTNGSAPRASAVQTHLNAIPALHGNVTVTGNDGGPSRIS